MKLSELNQIYQAFVELKDKFVAQTPDAIEKSLKKDFKVSNINQLPEPLQKALNNYKETFLALENACETISLAMMQKYIPEDEDIGVLLTNEEEEINYQIPAEFIKCYNLLPVYYGNLELEHQIAYKNQFYPERLAFTHAESDKTFLVTKADLAPSFFQGFIKDINDVLGLTSAPLDDLATTNEELKQHTHDRLNQAHINQGFYKDGYSCYFENQATFIQYGNRMPEASNVEKRVDDFVNDYVKKANLPEAIRPNLKAMLTTLTYQSGIANNSMSLIASLCSFNYHNFFNNATENTEFGNSIPLCGDSYYQHISFNEDFQLQIEYFCIDQKQRLIPDPIIIEAPYTRKITLTIDVTAENNIPSFKLNSSNFAYTTSIPQETAKNFELAITENALKNPEQLDENNRDHLRGCLENLAKFAGYDSLPEAIYGSGRTKTLKNAENNSKQIINFHPNLFSDLKKTAGTHKGFNEIEINFLNSLHTAFYKDQASKEILITKIFNFFSQQFTQVSLPDQLRYVYLLKMAKDLGAKPKDIDKVFNAALHESFNHQTELTENERTTITNYYKDFYNEKTTKQTLNNQMFAFLEEQLNKELKNSGENINTPRYIYLVNIAIDHSAYSLIQPFNSQNTTKILLDRNDNQEALFEAAKANKAIYREIVSPTPLRTLFSFKRFRRLLPNWFGNIKLTSQFSPRQHLELIMQYPDLLNDPPRNPYRTFLNNNQPQAKLNFLISYTRRINIDNPGEGWEKIASLGTNFFDEKFKEHLRINDFKNLEVLIKTGNPHFLKLIQTGENPIKHIFSEYANAKSVEDKLNKIIEAHRQGKTHLRDRFGLEFISQLKQQLNAVIKREMQEPTKIGEFLCVIFKENPWLYPAVGFNPAVETFISERSKMIEKGEAPLNEIKARSEAQAGSLVKQKEDKSPEESLKKSLINTEFKPLFSPPPIAKKPLDIAPSPGDDDRDTNRPKAHK